VYMNCRRSSTASMLGVSMRVARRPSSSKLSSSHILASTGELAASTLVCRLTFLAGSSLLVWYSVTAMSEVSKSLYADGWRWSWLVVAGFVSAVSGSTR
jgi:hypothetical protein